MKPVDLGPGEALLREGDPGRCVVVLPGVAYFSQAPLLWFAREAAQQHGWSVLELTERAPAGEEPFAWMRDRAERALATAAASAARVAVVGKSLGSVAARLAADRELPAVWLTPLLVRPEVGGALAAASAPTLLVGSPDDPTWASDAVPAGESLEVLELPGLDHSLQAERDTEASLEALRTVTRRVRSFIANLD